MRIGGFGGVAGLREYLAREGISHVVDATHPFAAQMSRNAIEACAASGTPLITLERPAWRAGPGDDWQSVADIGAAVAALPDTPARVFLAIGKQTLAPFAAKPQHHYLLRLVDSPEAALPLPQASVVMAEAEAAIGPDGVLRLVDPAAFLLNPWAFMQYAHNQAASVATSASNRHAAPAMAASVATLP